jgi:hypothetical protein
MRENTDTARLPRAMQSTNTATTIEKVNSEEPNERAPRRISTVWIDIIAKPSSRAATAKLRRPATGSPSA